MNLLALAQQAREAGDMDRHAELVRALDQRRGVVTLARLERERGRYKATSVRGLIASMVRFDRDRGETLRDLADDYGYSYSHISKICNGGY